jgi:hypothetical protein
MSGFFLFVKVACALTSVESFILYLAQLDEPRCEHVALASVTDKSCIGNRAKTELTELMLLFIGTQHRLQRIP